MAELIFEDCVIPEENLVGRVGEGSRMRSGWREDFDCRTFAIIDFHTPDASSSWAFAQPASGISGVGFLGTNT
jgi:hypothetical protein